MTLNLTPQASPSAGKKSPTRKKKLSDVHVMDMNKKKSPVVSLKKFKIKSPVAPPRRKGKHSLESPFDDSEDESEKSSTSYSITKGFNRQRSFTEATKKGLRRLSNAFKTEGDDENTYVTPTRSTTVSSSDLTSGGGAAAGAHPRSATVGMYVTPPTLERGIGGLHDILHAKKSLRKSKSNQKW